MAKDLSTLFVEKYRPKNIDDYIFQDKTQRYLILQMIAEENIPHLLLSGVQGSGKAQPLSSKVLTPSGWKFMGDIIPGDVVITPEGKKSHVQQIFPQEEKDIFTITFHDGSSTECCLDHLWECYFVDNYTNRTATKHIIDTRSIMSFLNKQKTLSTKFNISIPLIEPTETPEIILPIDPYVMGVLLGDGSLCSPTPKLTTIDEQIVCGCQSLLQPGYKIKSIKNTTKEYHIINEDRINFGGMKGVSENFYTAYFRSVGLHLKRSHEKFIPEDFKQGSISQRLSILQGLMDTDGTVGKKGSSASFTTTSPYLATEVRELLWSLGCTCTLTSRVPTYKYKGEKRKGKIAYTLHFNHNKGVKQFFRLSRKKYFCSETFARNHNRGDITLRRRIVSVEYKGREEAKCILIDDPSHLYITDDYIVTHNTTLARVIVNELDLDATDVLVINASDENSVDVMREKIKSFVTTYAMGMYKIVNLEEADYITPNGQAILRQIMEQYSDSCRFILTCNYDNKIIPAIKSRCQHFHFKAFNKTDIIERVEFILANEHISFERVDIERYVAIGYPDIRKIINLVQQNSFNKKLISPSQIEETGDYKFKMLELLETDNWLEIRKLLCKNVASEEWEGVYRFLYENLNKSTKFSIPENWEKGILIIADHLFRHGIVGDPEVNAAAMFIKLKNT